MSNDSVVDIIVEGGWIYYNLYNIRRSERYALCRIRTDGTSKEILHEGVLYGLNILDDWVYFYDFSELIGLYRISLDGSELELVH